MLNHATNHTQNVIGNAFSRVCVEKILRRNYEQNKHFRKSIWSWKSRIFNGIVLKNHGSYFLSDVEVEAVYEVFETYEAAKEFAIKQVENNSKLESFVINSKNEMVYYHDQNGERKPSEI